MTSSLTSLFRPRSIAVVGASDDPGKLGYALFHSPRVSGLPVYPVNARNATVGGERAYASVADIPTPVDLALLGVPPGAVPDVIEDCGRAGVGAAVVYAGGFAEVDAEDGRALQRRVQETARAHGVRLLGPNTSGFVNRADGLNATFLPDVATLPVGPLSVVAQSGGVNLALSFLAAQSGLGVQLAVGLGNSVDVGFTDVLEYLASDDATRVIALHVEGVRDGRGLMDALRNVTTRKPVVALKVGRADVGAFAASHTGAMIGSYELTRAALAQAGAVVVDDPGELVDAAVALVGTAPAPAPDLGVGLVTGQAGPGLIVADALRADGARLPELTAASQARLADLLPPITFQRNPVDTGRPGPTFGDVLDTVAADPGIELLACFLLEEPDAVDPTPALDRVVATGVPVLFGSGGPIEAVDRRRSQLTARGIPTFPAPERLANGVLAVVDHARARHRLATQRPCPTNVGAIPAGPIDEDGAKTLLAQLGIATTARRVCTSREELVAAVDELRGPLVLKVLDDAMQHKTDVGGVALGLRDRTTVLAALDDFTTRGLPTQRVLLEQEAPDGPDLIAGAVRDPVFGPAVMLGLGGTLTELVPPAAMRVAPLTDLDAEDMIECLPRALREGHRAAPPIDPDELVHVLASLGAVLIEHPAVASVEINPLRVARQGLLALDALIVTGDRAQ